MAVVGTGRRAGRPTRGGAFTLEVVAVLLALVSSWLGGELVERLGVGVDRGAHLDARSSLGGPAERDATGRTVTG